MTYRFRPSGVPCCCGQPLWAGSLWPHRCLPRDAAESGSAGEFVEVDTVEGRLRGQKQNGVCIFRGVRYAGAPVGAARFKAPPPLKKWKGVRDALVWGHPALQPPRQSFGVQRACPR